MPIYRRVGRPGLLGLAARTAVVAGTASAVGGAVSRRQRSAATQEQASRQQPAPQQPVTASADATQVVTPESQRLQQLADLHAQGVLTDAEFAAAKARTLGL